ncbi:MAG: putative peptide transporter substrate binding protein [Chloroflexi bacterium]|nr:putative peptide transporter substrate binding protein [Chloroflexota bacterium]
MFSAYPGYFLGRPKVDRIIARVFNDDNVLYASVLADEVDLLMDNSLKRELTFELGEQWERTGAGKVYLGYGPMRFAVANLNPELQIEPAFYDRRVRQALMHAIDRAVLTATVHRGHRELLANSLLPPSHSLYETVKDGYARYTYDPARARALLADAGWVAGPDGALIDATGRRFNPAPLWTSPGNEVEIGAIADYWKQVGVVVEQRISSLVQRRDQKFLSSFPLETTAAGTWDGVFQRVESRELAVAPTYAGRNKSHYQNPQVDAAIDRFRQSLDAPAQARAVKEVSDIMVEDLPLMPLFYNPTVPAAPKRIKALEDFRGGVAGGIGGTFSRNAHEWDIVL